jgi:peptidylprolyl isomerase
MNTKTILWTIALTAFLFSSCNETEDVNTQWRDENQTAYQAVQTQEGWRLLTVTEGSSDVYYKVIKSGDGAVNPLQTSRVKLLIWGAYYEGSVFLTGSKTTAIPLTLDVSNSEILPRGLSMAIQSMVVGDEWEVCVPYHLGFGIGGMSSSTYGFAVQGYSTLFYTVELKEITLYP